MEKQEAPSLQPPAKTVLIIAYYFPPMGGSGVQRPAKLAKYLPDYGWNPVILAPEPGAYYQFDESLLEELQHRRIHIERVKARTFFHFMASAAGGERLQVQPKEWKTRLLSAVTAWFFQPDNKTGWIEPALEKARELIARNKIQAVIATAPPYSNLLLAARLKREYGLPVIMDFRDDWLESHWISYPTRWHYRRMKAIEAKTLAAADLITVVNEAYKTALLKRVERARAGQVYVIPNGYDPENFAKGIAGEVSAPKAAGFRTFTLLHSGRFYSGIAPDALLVSISIFLKRNPEQRSRFRVQFQGGLTDAHRKVIGRLQLNDIIEDLGYVPHQRAVENLMKADALFLTLGNIPKIEAVTPGKVFEYIGSGKPVLAYLPEGVTADLLRSYGAAYICGMNEAIEQAKALEKMYRDWEGNTLPRAESAFKQQFSRKTIAREFGGLLDELQEFSK
ncbi:MAG: glycosyltransferase [Balneolales bacterium]|nr:glycosyltransferase [Balneolales bacterium]